jgi:hypothetical protein
MSGTVSQTEHYERQEYWRERCFCRDIREMPLHVLKCDNQVEMSRRKLRMRVRSENPPALWGGLRGKQARWLKEG